MKVLPIFGINQSNLPMLFGTERVPSDFTSFNLSIRFVTPKIMNGGDLLSRLNEMELTVRAYGRS